jgi:hypothetical protein
MAVKNVSHIVSLNTRMIDRTFSLRERNDRQLHFGICEHKDLFRVQAHCSVYLEHV